MKAKKTYAINILLLLAVFSISASPFMFKLNSAYEGTDDLAVKVSKDIAPGYTRWFKPFWEPPTEKVENLLFTFQAVIGLAFIAYYFGRKKQGPRPISKVPTAPLAKWGRRTIDNSRFRPCRNDEISASSISASIKPGTGESSDDRQVRILKRP